MGPFAGLPVEGNGGFHGVAFVEFQHFFAGTDLKLVTAEASKADAEGWRAAAFARAENARGDEAILFFRRTEQKAECVERSAWKFQEFVFTLLDDCKPA